MRMEGERCEVHWGESRGVSVEGEQCEAHCKGQWERSARLCREEAVACAD